MDLQVATWVKIVKILKIGICMRFKNVLLICIFLSIATTAVAKSPLKIFYLVPTDVDMPNQAKIDKILDIMIKSQYFYCAEMNRLGFGPLTFNFDEDIRVVRGKLESHEYLDIKQIHDDIPRLDLDVPHNVQVVFLADAVIFGKKAGVARSFCWVPIPHPKGDCSHTAVIPDKHDQVSLITAHEIGHTLTLSHTAINNTKYIMAAQIVGNARISGRKNINDFELSKGGAKQLNKNDLLTLHPNLLKNNKKESLPVIASYKIGILWSQLKNQDKFSLMLDAVPLMRTNSGESH